MGKVQENNVPNKYSNRTHSDVLKSKKFLTLLLTVVVNMVLLATPSFEPYRETILEIGGIIIGLIVGLIGAEDIALILRAAKIYDVTKDELENAIKNSDAVEDDIEVKINEE